MTSIRSYLLQAVYKWIIDNHLTPYIVINTKLPYVEVPKHYIKKGKIILNISPEATLNLNIDTQSIQFKTSFSGENVLIYAPIQAVQAIYAKENNRGLLFIEEFNEEDDKTTPPRVRPGTKPKLFVVK